VRASHQNDTASEITGQVLDEDGHPMSGVLVYHASSSELQATTDANGRYRIADATPGDYLFYCRLNLALREKVLQRNQKTGAATGYADTYYFPGVEHGSAAIRTIVVPGGHLSGLDFRLQRTLLIDFSGRILDRASGGPLNAGAVELEAGTFLMDQSRQRRTVSAGGSFRFEQIPTGRYTLAVYRNGGARGTPPPAGTSDPIERVLPVTERPVRVPVEIGRAGLAGAELHVPAYVDLAVNVTMPHPERTRGAFVVTLSRPGAFGKGEMFALSAVCQMERSCVVPDVPPGEWMFDVQGRILQSGEPARVVAVESIRFGQQNVWKVPVTVGEGGNPPAEISITDQVGTISGTIAMAEGQPADSSEIIFRRVGDNRQQRRNGWGPLILLDGLLPGDYALALFGPADDQDGGIRTAPLDRCGDRVAKVTVPAGQTSTVMLQPCVP
jgi:hypothetical protein